MELESHLESPSLLGKFESESEMESDTVSLIEETESEPDFCMKILTRVCKGSTINDLGGWEEIMKKK